MKAFSLLTAGALALTLGLNSADAAEKILISGSSAYRTAAHTALKDLLSPTPGFAYGWTGTPSSYTGASQAIFTGQINGVDVIVKTSWSGSALGVRAVVENTSIVATNFIPDNASFTSSGTSSLTANSSEIPNVAMSDVAAGATPFASSNLTSQTVGILPFVWMASKNAPAGLSNINPQLAQALFQAGKLPLSLFTGDSNDALKTVFAVGRNPDSGTRITAFAEAGLGLSAQTSVVQYLPSPDVSSAPQTVTGQVPWTAEDVAGIHFSEGNSGFDSGSKLANALRSTIDPSVNNGNAAYYVSYVGLGDASTAYSSGTGAKYLAWNGVDLTNGAGVVDLNKIRNGQYTFWSYEHFIYRNDLDTAKKSIADAIAAQIKITTASNVIKDDVSMKVSRDVDGGTVVPNGN